MNRPLLLAAVTLAAGLVACIEGGFDTGGDPYTAGCTDGYDVGYFNGVTHGETCSTYDDDPGERYDTGEDALYSQGYVECYPDGYADGYEEGQAGASC